MQPDYRLVGNDSLVISSGQDKVLRNTYWLLALSLLPTALGAVLGLSIDFGFLRSSPMLGAFGMLAVFYGWVYAIERNRDSGIGVVLLLGFTFFMGIILGPLLQVALGMSNGARLVSLAAGGTALAFFGLASVATTARRDFGFLGNFLMVGVIVVMLAVVANIFLASPLMHLVICGAFVLLSSALILFQLNAVVRGGETNYISATLSIYISIYNLFTSLLQILMAVSGQRD